jgi:uncharacterized protein YwgA
MKRRDWVLVVLSVADRWTLTPVQLQKSLFLLGKRYRTLVGSKFYRFKPYAYGPFDQSVYRDATDLAQEGLISIDSAGERQRRYVATLTGIEYAKQLPKFSDIEQPATEIVTWVQSRSFSELVSDIYSAYPEMRKNSIFR